MLDALNVINGFVAGLLFATMADAIRDSRAGHAVISAALCFGNLLVALT